MYSSPVTPCGTGRRFASSTRATALGIGLPIGGASSSAEAASGSLMVATTVVSVGP